MINVDETIQVAMTFRENKVRPAAFLWNGHRYDVNNLLFLHKTRVGERLRWHFTVTTTQGATARLLFDTAALRWQLETIELGHGVPR